MCSEMDEKMFGNNGRAVEQRNIHMRLVKVTRTGNVSLWAVNACRSVEWRGMRVVSREYVFTYI